MKLIDDELYMKIIPKKLAHGFTSCTNTFRAPLGISTALTYPKNNIQRISMIICPDS